jgi:hypothetical protein
MVVGFAHKIKNESPYWFVCGERVPRDEWLDRLAYIAENLIDALMEYAVDVNPWGPWATIWKESRGNRCAIGPHPREAAEKMQLVEEKFAHYWTEEDVKHVLTHRRWGNRPADLGLGQVVWEKYARIRDEETGELRVPTIEEMLTVEDGTRVMAWGMKYRARFKWNVLHKKVPWIYWPGNIADHSYAQDIQRIVREMGGPRIRVE